MGNLIISSVFGSALALINPEIMGGFPTRCSTIAKNSKFQKFLVPGDHNFDPIKKMTETVSTRFCDELSIRVATFPSKSITGHRTGTTRMRINTSIYTDHGSLLANLPAFTSICFINMIYHYWHSTGNIEPLTTAGNKKIPACR